MGLVYFELFVRISLETKHNSLITDEFFFSADQVFGDEEMHATVRQNCMDYIVSLCFCKTISPYFISLFVFLFKVKNADFFRAYITEDFDRYISRKRRQHCHGNHIEMIALSELYNRPIEVYEYSIGLFIVETSMKLVDICFLCVQIEPINTVHGMYKTDNEPIRLSYHCGVHYNSVIDPWRPTAGHGLGFPDLEPGVSWNAMKRRNR